jgi:ABC-type cobalamin/Fe3+-siderophores transport system ATPase subunit
MSFLGSVDPSKLKNWKPWTAKQLGEFLLAMPEEHQQRLVAIYDNEVSYTLCHGVIKLEDDVVVITDEFNQLLQSEWSKEVYKEDIRLSQERREKQIEKLNQTERKLLP